MAKELELTGQSFKTVREFYKMSKKQFFLNIAPIRKQLDKLAGRKNYRQLLPTQVQLIKTHFEG